MRRLIPNSVTTLDDWLVDIWFKGIRTGKVIHKRAGATPTLTEAQAIAHVLKLYLIHDPERVVDIKIARRGSVWTDKDVATKKDVMAAMIERYVGEGQ